MASRSSPTSKLKKKFFIVLVLCGTGFIIAMQWNGFLSGLFRIAPVRGRKSLVYVDGRPSYTNSTKVPMTVDLYEPGYDELDASNVCPQQGQDLKVLMMVTSAPGHLQARMSVRFTWGSFAKRKDVGLAFLLGRSTSASEQRDVELEADLYRDIVRGRSIDSYDNLTLKTVSMLEWVGTRCPLAPFLFKTDDDMFINVGNLLSFIDSNIRATRTIFGYGVQGWTPVRHPHEKNYLSRDQYEPDVFPYFTTGPSYMITRDAIQPLHNATLQLKYLNVEDVYLTGMAAGMVNVTRVNSGGFLNGRTPKPQYLDDCALSDKISYHGIDSSEQFKLWWRLLGIKSKCSIF